MRILLRILLAASASFNLPVSAQPADFDARFEEIRKSAAPGELYAFLYAMPKGGDIHHHLTLSFRAEDVLSAATDSELLHGNEYFTRIRLSNCPGDDSLPLRFRVVSKAALRTLPACLQGDYIPLGKMNGEQRQEWLSAMKIDKPQEGRNEFFEVIVTRLQELARDPYMVPELLAHTLKRYAREGVHYLETQYTPSDETAQRLRQRLNEPDVKSLPIAVRFQANAIRFRPDAEQIVERVYGFVDRNRDLWVGINLAGREDNARGYALRFLETFRKMRRQYSGIHLSIHGGEADAPGHEVRDTLLIGAERVGHGVNLITDPDTMLLMRGGRNLVECNLVSNRLLEYTPDLSKHPFIEYLRFGIPTCLNTDDSGVWDSNLTDEYFIATTNFNLSWDEVVRIGRNSLAYSFAQPALKRDVSARFEKDLAAFETRFRGGWRQELGTVKVEPSPYALRELLPK